MSKYEKAELTNMCMIYDGAGRVVVQDKVGKNWGGITFPGGHVEKDESFVDSVIREVKEETGLDIQSPKLCGIKWWEAGHGRRYIILLFKTDRYTGTLHDSNEGKVFWTELDALRSMRLAPSFDKMLDVFTNDNARCTFFYDKCGHSLRSFCFICQCEYNVNISESTVCSEYFLSLALIELFCLYDVFHRFIPP